MSLSRRLLVWETRTPGFITTGSASPSTVTSSPWLRDTGRSVPFRSTQCARAVRPRRNACCVLIGPLSLYDRRLWSADGTWERLLQQVQAEADAAGAARGGGRDRTRPRGTRRGPGQGTRSRRPPAAGIRVRAGPTPPRPPACSPTTSGAPCAPPRPAPSRGRGRRGPEPPRSGLGTPAPPAPPGGRRPPHNPGDPGTSPDRALIRTRTHGAPRFVRRYDSPGPPPALP